MNKNDFLKYSYESINTDLKLSETKNTFLTTFNLAIMGTTMSFLFDSDKSINNTSRGWLIAFLITIIVSTLVSIFSFIPLNTVICSLFKPKPETESKFMFYKDNFSRYKNSVDDFINDINTYFNEQEITPAEKQLAIQIVDLSRIAYSKFMLFTIALIIEIISFMFLIVTICL